MSQSTRVSERTPLVSAAPLDVPPRDENASGMAGLRSPTEDIRMGQLDKARAMGLQSRKRAARALFGAMCFCFVFMIGEVVAGVIAHSLAILTDAAHLLTDVGALSLALFALHASQRAADPKFSYGWHRAEVVGALGSVFLIWGLVGVILYESVIRINRTVYCAHHDGDTSCEGVEAPVMLIVGFCGMAVNVTCACILSWGGHHGHSHGASGGHGHSHGGGGCGGGSGGGDHGHAHSEEGHGHAHGDDHGHAHGEGNGDGHGHAHGDIPCNGHAHGGSAVNGDDGGHTSPAPAEDAHDHGHGGQGNVNVRGAFLHALGDCIQSLGVIIAGAIIWIGNYKTYGAVTVNHSLYNIADPCCSMLFGIITLFTTKGLFQQLIGILMESTPSGVDYGKVFTDLHAIPGVTNVHDLHIWSLTADTIAMSVHLISDDHRRVLLAAQDACHAHNIQHCTIQVDPVDQDVVRCGSNVMCAN